MSANTGTIREYRRDGSIHSVCRTCLVLIAAGRADTDLLEAEHNHVCSRVALAFSSASHLDSLLSLVPVSSRP